MSFHITLVLLRLLIVALGMLVVYLSFKSHRQNHSSTMLLLSMGFLLLTVGAVVEGILFEFFGLDIFGAHAVESILVASGLSVIVYSIYGTKS